MHLDRGDSLFDFCCTHCWTVASRVLKTTGVETFSRFSIRDPRLVLCDYSRDRRGGGNCNGVATWGADSAQLDVQVNL